MQFALQVTLGVLHSQIMAQELCTLNSKFVSSLWNNLCGIKPRTGRHVDRLQLLYPLLYGPHSDALLQDDEEELDSHVWFDKPWGMPLSKPGLPSFALQQALRTLALACSSPT